MNVKPDKQEQIVPYEPQTFECGKRGKTLRNMPSTFHLLAALLWQVPLRWKVLLAISSAVGYLLPQSATMLVGAWGVVLLIWLVRR